MQPGDDGGDLAALCQLEECVRGVEDAGLQEQHEGHPLVVRLVLHLIPLLSSPDRHQAHGFYFILLDTTVIKVSTKFRGNFQNGSVKITKKSHRHLLCCC